MQRRGGDFLELSDDNIAFRNPVYNKIMAAYREQWAQLGTGVEVPAHVFLNHIDPEVCNMSVDILTSDDNYVASELWRRKEIHIDTDAEMLAEIGRASCRERVFRAV